MRVFCNNCGKICIGGGNGNNGNGGGACSCCQPGMQAALQYVYEQGVYVTIITIAPTTGQSVVEEFIGTDVTALVQFNRTPETVYLPVCNIEYFHLYVGNSDGEIPEDTVDTFIEGLLDALDEVPTPEGCENCCPEELRTLLEAEKDTKVVTNLDTHKNNIFNNQDQDIEGTGPGVVVLYEGGQNPVITIVNLCYVSELELT